GRSLFELELHDDLGRFSKTASRAVVVGARPDRLTKPEASFGEEVVHEVARLVRVAALGKDATHRVHASRRFDGRRERPPMGQVPLDLLAELVSRREALLGIAAHRAARDRGQLQGNRLWEREPRENDRRDDRAKILARVWRLPGEDLVKDRAEEIDVGAL